MTKPPEWFSASFAVAQHMDAKASWPWLFRKLHEWFIARHCPCCIEEAKWNK